MNTVKRISSGVAGLALLLVSLGAACMIIANLRLRADLTEERLFTLSRGSRDLVSTLDQDVTLKFYFSASSPDVPQMIKMYAHHVQDFLREYELAGKGRVIIETYDPKSDSDEEEWAQKFGVAPQTLSPFSPPFYFGLVAVCGGRENAIPAFSPATERTLEYEVSRLVARVAWPDKPVIGVMSPLNVLGADSDPMQRMMGRNRQAEPAWAVFGELQRDNTLRTVAPDADRIDDDITTLVLVHPKNLSDQTLFAIDQFVLRGGRLLACLDPFSIQDFRASQGQGMMMGMRGPGGPGPSTLGRLLDAWGVGFDPAKVLADMRAITKLDGGNGSIDENPVVLSLSAKNAAASDVLTAQIKQLILPFAGVFTDKQAQNITFTPLITSSDNACLVDTMSAQYGTAMLRNQLTSDGMRHALAVRLTGTFKTAFPDGAPADENPDPTGAKKPADPSPKAPLTSGTGAVVLIGDSDFLADNWSVRTSTFLGYQTIEAINDNLALLANAVEQLAGRSELIAIRSRGNSARPFTVVDELEYQALKKWSETEKTLQFKLDETRARLAEMQKQKQGKQRAILTAEQEKAIATFQEDERSTNRQLKDLRRSLNADIENLGILIKSINIALMPGLIIVVSFARLWVRRRRS
jgi:ABC-type uncharacterized transport system involved in gliding motility auxiliary subunit